MTAKEYLSQAYRLDQRIDSNIAEITRLREMACGISSPSWEEKVQTSRNTDAPFVRCLEKIMDLEKVVNSEIDTLVDLKRQIRLWTPSPTSTSAWFSATATSTT